MDESYLTRCLTSTTDNIFVFSRGYQRTPTTPVTFVGIDVYTQNTAAVTTALLILCGQTSERQMLKTEKTMVLVMLKIPENIYPLTLFSHFLTFRYYTYVTCNGTRVVGGQPLPMLLFVWKHIAISFGKNIAAQLK
jgi:hypothetical protein